MRILLVEDDPLLGDGISEGLLDQGYTVDWLRDGAQARAVLTSDQGFDAVVLDLNLPGIDGLEVLRALRMRESNLPVLILTARDALADRISGLDAGADDYLTKPFALSELAARLRALIRRRSGDSSALIRRGRLTIDTAHQHAALDGEPLELTGQEYRLLWLLARSHPHLLSREQIEERLYGWNGGAESNAFEVHLSHLRKKLGRDAIVNVRGLGWRMADIQ